MGYQWPHAHRRFLGGLAEAVGDALASAQMKLSAALLTLNQHAECISAAGAAAALEPSIASALSGLQKLCERGRDEGLDTSKVKIDLAL